MSVKEAISATFPVHVDLPGSTVSADLEELARTTESLRVRNLRHAEFDEQLDQYVRQMERRERVRKHVR